VQWKPEELSDLYSAANMSVCADANITKFQRWWPFVQVAFCLGGVLPGVGILVVFCPVVLCPVVFCPHTVKFDTYQNLQRHRAVLPAIARLSCSITNMNCYLRQYSAFKRCRTRRAI